MALVGGLPAALARMKEAGIWVVGLDDGAERDLFDLGDLASDGICLVLGAEGSRPVAPRPRALRPDRQHPDARPPQLAERQRRRRPGHLRGRPPPRPLTDAACQIRAQPGAHGPRVRAAADRRRRHWCARSDRAVGPSAPTRRVRTAQPMPELLASGVVSSGTVVSPGTGARCGGVAGTVVVVVVLRRLGARRLDDLLAVEAERRRARRAEAVDELGERGDVVGAVEVDDRGAVRGPSRWSARRRSVVELGDARQGDARLLLERHHANHSTASPSRSATTTHWPTSASLVQRDLAGRVRLDDHRARAVDDQLQLAVGLPCGHREARVAGERVHLGDEVDVALRRAVARRRSPGRCSDPLRVST